MVRTVADGGRARAGDGGAARRRARAPDRPGDPGRGSACFHLAHAGRRPGPAGLGARRWNLLLVNAPGGLLEDARILPLLADGPVRRRDVGSADLRRAAAGCSCPSRGSSTTGARWSSARGSPGGVATGDAPARRGDRREATGATPAGSSASASLAVQRALGVGRPSRCSSRPSPDALVAAAEGAGAVVVGLTDRWRRDGLGRARTALATRVAAPVLLVRRGTRPGGLAPRRDQTRFTWTIAG